MNFCVAPNGCVFDQSKPGVFAQYMAEVFAQRSAIRKEIKEHNKELETCKDKKRIEELKGLITQKDILQYALKILINSAYGAISSAKNPIGDTDLANAITTAGSTSIKYINVLARRFVQMKNPNISANDLEAVVVFNDTDSCCIRLDKCGVEVCKDGAVTPEGYVWTVNAYASTTGSCSYTLPSGSVYFMRQTVAVMPLSNSTRMLLGRTCRIVPRLPF